MLSPARDAAGREEPQRCSGRVMGFALVLVGVLALVAAAGRGATDTETHNIIHHIIIEGGGYYPADTV